MAADDYMRGYDKGFHVGYDDGIEDGKMIFKRDNVTRFIDAGDGVHGRCEVCNRMINVLDAYCRHCGRRIK